MILLSVTMLLAVCAVRCEDGPSMADLKKALKEGKEYWITKRTYKPSTPDKEHMCVRVEIGNVREKDFDFQQYFKSGDEPHHLNLHGTFFVQQEPGKKPGFIVKGKDGKGDGVPYTLMNWDDTNKCGVLHLKRADGDAYELHVLNDRIDTREACEEKFTEISGGDTQYSVYLPDCQNQRGEQLRGLTTQV